MRKILLLLIFIQCVYLAQAQPVIDIDDAVLGTGTNQNNYVGAGWVHATATTEPYLFSTCSYSNVVNSYATVQFKGDRIEVVTRIAHHHGIVAISVDNGPETMADLYARGGPATSFITVFTKDMPEGNHTLKLRVTGFKNQASSNTYVVLDHVRVYSAAGREPTNTKLGFEALQSNTIGYNNSAYGSRALNKNSIGQNNTALGFNALSKNTTASFVTATGAEALSSNTTGESNTATGYRALYSNTTGIENVAIGREALLLNSTGGFNTAIGNFALRDNSDGYHNIAIGFSAMLKANRAGGNIAIGNLALSNNSTGSYNTAVGDGVMPDNTTGNYNVAIGNGALRKNTTGIDNVAMGLGALGQNVNGYNNTVIGSRTMRYSTGGASGNTVVGAYAMYADGQNLTAIGFESGYATDVIRVLQNSTAIGYQALMTASNQVRLGNSQVTSIGGIVSWSTLSDGRFKKDVKEDVSGLTFINQLRPVSYSVDVNALNKFLRIPDSTAANGDEARKKPVRQTGFVAQEVEAIVKKTGYAFNGVEAPKNENDHYSIRYAEFVVPLVKAVQELTTKLEDQDKKISTLVSQLKKHGLSPGEISETSDEAELHQNNPNPFSVDTEIKVSLPETALSARVIIYNMEGKQLKDYAVQGRGKASIKISGSELNAGMYLYALIIDGQVVDTKRMILTN